MRERAKQLGGELTVSGIPGHGTTVRLNLPLVVPEQATP
jgi:signal transduction histidine kinase